jgi:hypothetical protein
MERRNKTGNRRKESYLQKVFTKQNSTALHRIKKKHRAIVRKMTRRQRREDWDKFVKTLERDITGTPRRGFKIYKQLQLQFSPLHSKYFLQPCFLTNRQSNYYNNSRFLLPLKRPDWPWDPPISYSKVTVTLFPRYIVGMLRWHLTSTYSRGSEFV